MTKAKAPNLPIWYAVRTTGKFRAGRFYRTAELGVLGRMARKAGYLILMDMPEKLTRPAQKAANPRKKAAPTPVQEDDGQAPV